MAKVSVNLDDDLDGDDSARKLKELAAPLPSVSKAKSTALKDAPRVQFSFTNVPNSFFRGSWWSISVSKTHFLVMKPRPK